MRFTIISMTSTSWFFRINAAAVDDSKHKVGSKNCDDSFPLIPAIAVGVGASALLGVLYFYRSQDGNTDHKGDGTLSRDVNSDIDNVGDWGRKKSSKTSGGSSDNDNDDDDTSFEMPQHLQRELYKEERRKASVRFLAMKRPLYENIEMYAPDGETMLCTIGTKKANWYVRKKLAVWRDIPDCHKSILLLFEPKNSKKRKETRGGGNEEMGNDEKLREYNCTHKLNICVSCGAKDASESDGDESAGLMRHYVVPYAYRKLFPTKFKTHLPHDVVLLCLDCHVEAEQAAKIQKTDVYEKLYRRDPSTRLAVVVDQDLKRIKSYARALWMHRDKLPDERIRQYETAIEEHLCGLEQLDGQPGTSSKSCERNISQDILRELAENLQPERKNPKHIPLADLVIENLCQTDEDVSKFVVGWRKFFIDTLRPRHLPVGWSVDSPVEVDVNPVEEHDEDRAEEKTKEDEQ